MSDTCLPRASPYLSRTIACLLSHPLSLFGKTRKIVAHYSRHAAFQAQNGGALIPDGETRRSMEARMMVSVSLREQETGWS